MNLLQDCTFADGKVNADIEATVLAAFAYWAQRNKPVNTEQIAAICSRIRFPAIPLSVLHNYWRTHDFMQRFDPGDQILLRAVSCGTSPPHPSHSRVHSTACSPN